MPMLLQTSASSPPAMRRDCRGHQRLRAPAAAAATVVGVGMTWTTMVVVVAVVEEEAEAEEEDAGARPAPVRQRLPQQLPTRCRCGAARMASLVTCYDIRRPDNVC